MAAVAKHQHIILAQLQLHDRLFNGHHADVIGHLGNNRWQRFIAIIKARVIQLFRTCINRHRGFEHVIGFNLGYGSPMVFQTALVTTQTLFSMLNSSVKRSMCLMRKACCLKLYTARQRHTCFHTKSRISFFQSHFTTDRTVEIFTHNVIKSIFRMCLKCGACIHILPGNTDFHYSLPFLDKRAPPLVGCAERLTRF